ncbi:ABC transporter substrate-binding protein [Methylophaga sp.]|uniref:ABC transporter substrate-binding protein n=1 Tax=Methylophaga sp. TaxID=2024840 RepID=UPI00271A1B4A|nr:ABC transporter substrate-binding protein [Methylophaga sp.]MDO8826723.1 ABC transporter substrate-binding protein [Methylophaga sp.]
MRLGKQVVFLLVITSLFACDWQIEKPLRVGTIPWAGYEILYLARDLAYYDDSQIQLKELTTTTDILNAFRQGQLDAIAVTLDEALRLTESQADLKFILIFNISDGADKLIVNPDITSLAELKGKRIAVEQSGVGAYMLSQVLQIANLAPSDTIIIPSTVNQHSMMLNSGEVDAVISFDPIAYQLQKQGYINLLDSRMLPGQIVDVLITKDLVLKEQQQNLQHLLHGYWKARKYLADNPDDALSRIAPRLGVSTEELSLFYQNLILPEREQQRTIFNQQLEKIIEQMSALMIESGLLKNAIDSQPLLVHDSLE